MKIQRLKDGRLRDAGTGRVLKDAYKPMAGLRGVKSGLKKIKSISAKFSNKSKQNMLKLDTIVSEIERHIDPEDWTTNQKYLSRKKEEFADVLHAIFLENVDDMWNITPDLMKNLKRI